MKPFSKVVFYRLPVIALCGFLFWQSSFPGMISEPLFPHDDKVMHFLAYGLLAFLTVRCMAKENISAGNIYFFAFIFTVTFGLSDEIHQSFVPQRCASGYDLVADAVGAVAGLFFYRIVIKTPRLNRLA